MGSDRDELAAVLDELEATEGKFAALNFDALTAPELLTALDRREQLRRRDSALDHVLIARLVAQAGPRELGAKSWPEALAARLRISPAQARRRLADAADLGPRTAISGEPLAPALAEVAAAQARGELGAEHIAVSRSFFDHLPAAVDAATRDACEQALVQVGSGNRPDELRQFAERLALYVHPDGQFSDADRARRRGLTLRRQQRDGMTEINGLLDPEALAYLQAVFAVWAAPGMCNPNDGQPCTDGEPGAERARSDARSVAQRQHDALEALARAMLASGQLGQHRGLPATVVVTTSLADLESATGHAVTAGGAVLPMSDVIRLASHSHHYLAVFDRHTEVPLYLGRTKRLASPGQRLVLYAKYRGCTFPGCTAPAHHTEVHHAINDWAAGGRTDITDETLGCTGHHHLTEHDWHTAQDPRCDTEWIPPPHLDSGQSRTNPYHHPERYLKRQKRGDEDDDEGDP